MTSPRNAVLLDVNVLIALSLDTHVHHRAAHRHFSQLSQWSTCSITEGGLLRALLTEKLTGRTVEGPEALGQLRAIRAVPGWRFLDDSTSLAAPSIDTRVLAGRRQVTDLQLLNLAAHHGTRLATFDAAMLRVIAPADRDLIEVWED